MTMQWYDPANWGPDTEIEALTGPWRNNLDRLPADVLNALIHDLLWLRANSSGGGVTPADFLPHTDDFYSEWAQLEGLNVFLAGFGEEFYITAADGSDTYTLSTQNDASYAALWNTIRTTGTGRIYIRDKQGSHVTGIGFPGTINSKTAPTLADNDVIRLHPQGGSAGGLVTITLSSGPTAFGSGVAAGKWYSFDAVTVAGNPVGHPRVYRLTTQSRARIQIPIGDIFPEAFPYPHDDGHTYADEDRIIYDLTNRRFRVAAKPSTTPVSVTVSRTRTRTVLYQGPSTGSPDFQGGTPGEQAARNLDYKVGSSGPRHSFDEHDYIEIEVSRQPSDNESFASTMTPIEDFDAADDEIGCFAWGIRGIRRKSATSFAQYNSQNVWNDAHLVRVIGYKDAYAATVQGQALGGSGGAGGAGGAVGDSFRSTLIYATAATNAAPPAVGSPTFNGTAWTLAAGWSETRPPAASGMDIYAAPLSAAAIEGGGWRVTTYAVHRTRVGTAAEGAFPFQYSSDGGNTAVTTAPANFGQGREDYVRVLTAAGLWSPWIYAGPALNI